MDERFYKSNKSEINENLQKNIELLQLRNNLLSNSISEVNKLEIINNYSKPNEIKAFNLSAGGLFKDFDFSFLYYIDF